MHLRETPEKYSGPAEKSQVTPSCRSLQAKPYELRLLSISRTTPQSSIVISSATLRLHHALSAYFPKFRYQAPASCTPWTYTLLRVLSDVIAEVMTLGLRRAVPSDRINPLSLLFGTTEWCCASCHPLPRFVELG
jgi:hypothetical protein